MLITRIVSAFALVCLCGAETVSAQSLGEFQTPAEFPPASYTAKQYVDSRGCVYIRAGIDGAVNWVPRVNRDRKPVCGFKPTGIQSATAGQAPSRKPVPEIKIDPPSSTTGSAAAKAAAPDPKPRPQPKIEQPPRPAAVAVAVSPVLSTAPKTSGAGTRTAAVAAARPATTAKSVVALCPDGSRARRDYVNDKGQRVLVCSAGSLDLASVITPAKPAKPVVLDANTRVLPRAVYSSRRNAAKVRVPAGYRAVWKDDRLNPHRGEQGVGPAEPPKRTIPAGYRVAWDDGRLNLNRGNVTAAGQESMDRVWTQTVPRKLIHVPVPKNATVLTRGSTSPVFRPVRVSTRSLQTAAQVPARTAVETAKR